MYYMHATNPLHTYTQTRPPMHKPKSSQRHSKKIFTCILHVRSKITYVNLCFFPAVFPQRRWEAVRATRQPVQRDENKPFSRGGGGEKKKKKKKRSLRLLAAHTNVLRSNLSGVLFASYFNKGAQWVYQTALMKGLLAGLPAADPLDPECVFTINPPLCLQQATSSTPLLPPASPPPLTHKRPHLQERAPTPSPCLPQNLPPISPQVLHTYAHSQHTALAHSWWWTAFAHTHTHTCTRSYVTRRTCGTTQIRSVNLHILCSNGKKNMQRSNV